MSNDFPLNANEIYDQLEIPCDYFLELDSSLFTTGTTEVGICPTGGLGSVLVRRPQLSVCLLLVLLEAMEVLQTSPVRFSWVDFTRLSYFEHCPQLRILDRGLGYTRYIAVDSYGIPYES